MLTILLSKFLTLINNKTPILHHQLIGLQFLITELKMQNQFAVRFYLLPFQMQSCERESVPTSEPEKLDSNLF